jgi:hypothetical protein
VSTDAVVKYVLDELLEGERPIKLVPFPGDQAKHRGLSVGLWSLSQHETTATRLAAIRFVRETYKILEPRLPEEVDILDEEVKLHTLHEAMRDPRAPDRRAASSLGTLRQVLTPDLREALWTEYLIWIDATSPLQRVESSAEVERIVDAVGKAPDDESCCRHFDIVSLRRIVLSLGRTVATLRRANSSVTSLLSEPSDSST